MANSYVTYTGNGATVQYNVTFAFLSRSHVAAYLDGVETSAFTWISDSLIQFNAAPGNGVAIKIARETPTTPLTDFVDGSTLTEDDLDNALLQSLYVAEEAADRSNDALNLNTAGTMWDAESKIIDNVAEPTATDHAATKNYVDSTTAASAAAAAASAAAAAASATAAQTAETNAETAETNAELAEVNAEAAQAAAEAAAASIPSTPFQTADIGDNQITDGKLRDSAAVSVIGRSANSSGDPADIAAGANDRVLRRVSNALDFGQITAGMIPNATITKSMIENVAADKLLGRGNGGGAGAPQEIALGTGLSMSGTTLNASATSVGYEVQKSRTEKTDTFQQTGVTGGTWYAVTGLTATINSVASGNDVRIRGHVTVGAGAAGCDVGVRIKRDTTVLLVGAAAGSRNQALVRSQVSGAGITASIPIDILDVNPGAGSYTYSVEVMQNQAQNINVNRDNNDSDAATTARATSVIEAIEIKR